MEKQEKAIRLIEAYTSRIEYIKALYLQGRYNQARMDNDIRHLTVGIRNLCKMIETNNYLI